MKKILIIGIFSLALLLVPTIPAIEYASAMNKNTLRQSDKAQTNKITELKNMLIKGNAGGQTSSVGFFIFFLISVFYGVIIHRTIHNLFEG